MSSRKRMPSYRPWGSTEDGNIEFESLTKDTLEGALKVLRESFFPFENVCIATGVNSESIAREELEQLVLDAARDGISVVAVDVVTGQVVGVAFNKLQIPDTTGGKTSFELFGESCKSKRSKALVDFMVEVDAKIDLFKHYNVDCILEIVFLATLQQYGKRRVGELLVSSSIELARELKRGHHVKTLVDIDGSGVIHRASAVPSLVSAIMTSAYSRKIALKLGFENLMEISYDQFEFDGQKRTCLSKTDMPLGTFVDANRGIEYRLLTEDRIEDVIRIQQESMKQECIAMGVGMYDEAGAADEMQLIFREVIKDGMTIVAVDLKTGETAGVSFNKLHIRPKNGERDPLDLFIENNVKHRACLNLLEFLDHVESSVDIFSRYGAYAMMAIFYIGVSPGYLGRGIGSAITKASLELGRGLLNGEMKRTPIGRTIVPEVPALPEVAFGTFASNYSQSIAEKLGFESLAEFWYEDYLYGGKKMSERIGPIHKTARLAALSLR
ncbi:hypothetical protein KM043_012909 [Ampulex compressa]|nr:hypothetical protein KM043_012909 [Ampulex compressa]